MKTYHWTAAVVFSLVAASCAKPDDLTRPARLKGSPAFEAVRFTDLPGWRLDSVAAALPAFARSCAVIAKRSPNVPMAINQYAGIVQDWADACKAIPQSELNAEQARGYFETWFTPYRVMGNDPEMGLFTGYFEADLLGSRHKDKKFTIPIYRRPRDLVLVNLGDWRNDLAGRRISGRVINGRLKPYYSRSDIRAGRLEGIVEPLVWLDDPVDAFFLHIQGSGRVRLSDGAAMRIGYDGHNGHAYYPIGRHLIETGAIPREGMSMQKIRAWLEKNPTQKDTVMNLNGAYIFFREVRGDGPLGAQGVVLSPGRSLAVDPRAIPLGLPVWIDVNYPDEAGKRLRRLMVAQDTGGAIKGPVRADIFWGNGSMAERLAGPMKAGGSYFVFIPKGRVSSRSR
ncbi:MAG: murein transglycosylase [Rhodospirillaceae bacterium]|nr:murein transglycosylase [Rhodospirillaceae bacterium]